MMERLLNWLSADTVGPLNLKRGSDTYLFMRVEKSPGFDYLYCQHQYHEPALVRGDSFKYIGLYYRGDGQIYDAHYELMHISDEDSSMGTRGKMYLLDILKKDVRQLVEAQIGNDRNNLQVTEIKGERNRQNLENYPKNYAHRQAREIYLSSDEGIDTAFRCRYSPENWTEDSLLSYISDPQGYAEQEAESYMADNQETMLLDFLCGDVLLAEYQALVADTNNPVHIVKKIMAAMNTTSAKTVNVTICKNGEEFTFKTEAQELRRDCSNYYSTCNIQAADRRRFAERFGKNADYYPQEIVRITYGRTVLYEAER